MKNKALKNFELHFPSIVKDIDSFSERNEREITVTLRDGGRVLYDDDERTLRSLPRNSREMTEIECRHEFGLRLRKAMSRKGITQSDLSEMTGIQQSQLSHYINGINSPSFYNADKIAKALGCSLEEFRYID